MAGSTTITGIQTLTTWITKLNLSLDKILKGQQHDNLAFFHFILFRLTKFSSLLLNCLYLPYYESIPKASTVLF